MTEKDYAPQQKESKKMVVKAAKEKVEKAPVKKEESKNEVKVEEKKEVKKVEKPKVKKTEAVVNAKSLPISTKHSMAICRFIKGKRINDSIEYLEKVIVAKKAIPMKGEIPHRKGKGMERGRFPKKASEQFIVLLRSLGANANANGLEDAIISEAVSNMASRPYGRFGRTRKKRTHVTIKCREKKIPGKKK
jgi:ribosomal protein L22